MKTKVQRAVDHPLYRRWGWMRGVCTNPDFQCYDRYGARGIQIDPEFDNFWNFVEIIETKLGYPKDFNYRWKLSRRDQTGDYTIKNLQWSLAQEVSFRCPHVYRIKYRNRTLTMREWSKITGINFHTMLSRYQRGWSPAECLGYKART